MLGPTDPEPARRVESRIEPFDWVVFTSANGVERFWRELELQSRPGLPSETRLAAIGPATAEMLEMRGVSPEVVPEEYVAEAVADSIIAVGSLAGRRLLLPRAAGARRVLPERLSAAGARVDEVIAYESKPDLKGIARLRAAIEAGEVDMITFTAASTVRHYVETAGTELGGARVAAIGPITAQAARAAGLRVDAEAREYTVEGLLQAILEYFSDLRERG